jgi:hypothetical protein
MPMIRGRVVSGMGSFSVWIERLRDHYLRKTGMLLWESRSDSQAWRILPGGNCRLL